MKVLFIGFGSIAKRHVLNLHKILQNDLEITVLRSGKGKDIPEDICKYITRICKKELELEQYYDAIFITNPTAYHYDTLLKHNDRSDCFFIEKPVFMTGTENLLNFAGGDKKYYVACPLRYTNVIQYLKKNIDFTHVHSIRAISSSYLPDWRPGTDYRNSYSAHKDMGGGVSIDLIHEWDYITYLIGFPVSTKNLIRKKSDLEIDSDDLAVYIAEYPDKIVELHLDYFGKKTIRKVELIAEDDTVVADFVDQRVEWMGSGRLENLQEDRDSFQIKELQHFLKIVSGEICSDNNIEEACRVLRIARGEE